MTTSIYDDAKRTAKTEYLRLTGLGISIATDEQIAKGREKREDFTPRATMFVTWEPVSYRLEGGKYGNQRTEYLPFTFGTLTTEDIAAVRAHGWRGAGTTGKRMSIPSVLAEAKDVWPYFMVSARNAGLQVDITEDGQLSSPQVGHIFEVAAGTITLPKRIQDENTGRWRDSKPEKGEPAYTPFVRIPVRLADDYVIPENVPVIVIAAADEDDRSTPSAAPTTTAGGSSVTPELLAAAFVEAGLIGAQASDYASMPQQVAVTNKFVGRAPVLAAAEVQTAASAGGLIDYAVAKGAISVVDGVITREA